jgi:hypothetical protein
LVEIAVDDGTTETTESVLVSVNDPDLTSLLPNNTWDFGTLASGDSTVSKQFYIRDIVAAVNMEIGQEMGEDPAISGSGSSYFSIDAGDNPDGDTIAPGDDATITIVCDPAGATGGVQSATLSIPYNNAVQSPLEITLSFTASSSEDGGGILSRNRRRRLFPRKRALE